MPKRLAFPPPLVESHIDALFHDDLHAQRVRSLADGTLGVLQSGALGIHAIGRGLAVARGLLDKHAIKQMDRLIGNDGTKTDILLASWATHVIGARTRIVVNLDWTEVDDDDQAMLVVGMQTDHGRSTPLAWQTVVKSTLAGKRNDYEDALLARLRGAIPTAVHVTVVADRGFADQHLYAFLEQECHRSPKADHSCSPKCGHPPNVISAATGGRARHRKTTKGGTPSSACRPRGALLGTQPSGVLSVVPVMRTVVHR